MKKFKKVVSFLCAAAIVTSFTVSVGSADFGGFADVKSGSWYASGVATCAQKGIVKGTSETTFSPDKAITRGEFATMLFRTNMMAEYNGILKNKELEGDAYLAAYNGTLDEYIAENSEALLKSDDASKFADVDGRAFYAAAVAWGVNNEYIFGTSDTTFSPNANITREQMVTILYRYQQAEGIDAMYKTGALDYVASVAKSFGFESFGKEVIVNTDVLKNYEDGEAVSSFAKEAIAWAIQSDYISGTSPSTLSPEGTTTRAQMATIIARMLNNIELAGCANAMMV